MKVIVLGAGSGQIPFIQLCKERNHEVIVIGLQDDSPGFQMADKTYYVDIKDKETILEIAKKEKVGAIMSDQSDYAVPTAAYVAEQMGLCGIGYDKALYMTNKYLMRCKAKEIGVAVPEFAKALQCADVVAFGEKYGFPIIIKPVDSAGSRGVHRCDSVVDVEAYFDETKQYSTTGEVIVEQFIQGREYIVDGLALKHKYINLDLGIKEYFNKKDRYISKMCMFSSVPSVKNPEEKKVLAANLKLAKGLELPYAITHAEYIYCDKEDKVYLVEIAARGGGIYLSSHLTPKATGIDTNKMIVEYILHPEQYKDVDIEQLEIKKGVSAWRCFELQKGTIVKMEHVDELTTIPGVFKVCLEDLYVGKEVEEMVNDIGKHGPILVSGTSREECFETLRTVEQVLKMETKNGDSYSEIIW